jgi:hypothetical protein
MFRSKNLPPRSGYNTIPLRTECEQHKQFCSVLCNKGEAFPILWAGWRCRYTSWLRDGQSGDQIPVGARFSAHVQTGPGVHPASCTMGTGSFLEVKSGRGVTLTPQHLLVPWSWKSRAIPLLPFRVVRPVQSLSAYTRVHFLFPILAWEVPEVSRRLRFPNFSRQMDNESGKLVSPQNRPALPHKEIFQVLISVRGWVDPRATVRPEGLRQW